MVLQQGFGRSAEQNRGLGGDIRLKGGIPAVVPTAAWRETWLGLTKHNSRKYIATRDISTCRGRKSAVFTMCYATTHPAIGQSTCTELARGPWVTGGV